MMFDSITDQYFQAAYEYGDKIVDYALATLTFLTVLHISWSFVLFCLNHNKDGNKWISDLALKMIIVTITAWLIQDYRQILQYIYLGFEGMGFELVGGSQVIKPGDILSRGVSLATTAWSMAFKSGLLRSMFKPGSWITLIIGALLFYIFARIAIEFVLIQISARFLLATGIIILAFVSNKWTKSLANRYFIANITMGIHVLYLIMLLGIGFDLSSDWIELLRKANQNPISMMQNYLSVIAGAMVYYYLCLHLPSRISQMLTSGVSFDYGANDAGMLGMTTGTGVVTGAIQGVRQSITRSNGINNSSQRSSGSSSSAKSSFKATQSKTSIAKLGKS